MSVDRLLVVTVEGQPDRVTRSIEIAAGTMAGHAGRVVPVEVPAHGLPEDAAPGVAALAASFAATPSALLEAWRVARHLDALTEPGDTVLLTDHRGLGGVFALEQRLLPDTLRRTVWTVVGDGVALELLDTVGTLDGVDAEDASAVDWELVQYEASAWCVTLAAAVPRLATALVDAVVLRPHPLPPPLPATAGPRIGLPEPVSRRSHSFQAMRGLSGHLMRHPQARLVVSEVDSPDLVWQGSTWDTMQSLVSALSPQVERGDASGCDLLILGDPTAVPSPAVRDAVAGGAGVVVRANSTAAGLWPTAPTWHDEDSLAATLRSPAPAIPQPAAPLAPPPSAPVQRAPDRARRVSVGIPVYRDVRFLDEAVRSVLLQTQRPSELILYDDGSICSDVRRALARWQEDEPELIRSLHGPNRGVCVARNHMLEVMTGDAFYLLDADDVLDPSCLERCAEALRSLPEAWAIAVWTRFFGTYEAVEAKPPFGVRVAIRENPIVSTAALVDMKVRDLGIRFAPDLAFLYCEDWHYWSQIVAAGGTIGLIPEPLARHRVHEQSGGFRRTELALSVGRARAIEPLRAIGAGSGGDAQNPPESAAVKLPTNIW